MKDTQAAGFCRRFAIAVNSGVDLIAVIRAEARQGPARQRDELAKVAEGMAAGFQMSDVMSESKFWPPLMLSLTRVGEATGRMDRAYHSLADHYDNAIAVKRSFVISISWPVIQLFLGILAIGGLIWLLGVLKPPTGGEMHDILGWGLRGTSGMLTFFGLVGIVFACLFGIYKSWTMNLGNVQRLIPLFYMIPRLGPAIQTITMARFAWTLSTTLETGLDPIRSTRLSLESTGSEYYSEMKDEISESLQAGTQMSEAYRSAEIFPDEFLTKLAVAEMSGSDAEGLVYIAQDYQQRAKSAIRTISGIFTAIIWLTIAGVFIYMIYCMAMEVFFKPIAEALKPI